MHLQQEFPNLQGKKGPLKGTVQRDKMRYRLITANAPFRLAGAQMNQVYISVNLLLS
jgi:hypothetical protein